MSGIGRHSGFKSLSRRIKNSFSSSTEMDSKTVGFEELKKSLIFSVEEITDTFFSRQNVIQFQMRTKNLPGNTFEGVATIFEDSCKITNPAANTTFVTQAEPTS